MGLGARIHLLFLKLSGDSSSPGEKRKGVPKMTAFKTNPPPPSQGPGPLPLPWLLGGEAAGHLVRVWVTAPLPVPLAAQLSLS